jgi:hypothetical protein
MTLGDISTEMLIKLRERFQSGRTRIFAVAINRDARLRFERKVIEAVEDELRRRLN